MSDIPESTQNTSPTAIEKTIGKKRKRSASSHDDDDQPAVKYLELAEVFTLDLFSDEVLFEIFKYLDTFTLLALEKTCTRFFGLVQDHRLWNDINLLEEEKPVVELKHALKRANKKTKSVKVSGLLAVTNPSSIRTERECILKYVVPKCEDLSDLELQSVFIDFLTIKIQDFPRNLKRLVFRDVSVRWPDNAPTVFQKMDKNLLYLEELRVEACTWFHPYDIMLFSKCPSLKTLSMRGCQNLNDFVPYGSMASRFGFKTLEHLDVRDTPITDSDLQCFNAILTLKELLLQCPTYLRLKSPEDKICTTVEPTAYTFTPTSISPVFQVATTSTSESSSSSSTSSSTFDGSNDSAEVIHTKKPRQLRELRALRIPKQPKESNEAKDPQNNDGEPSTSRQRDPQNEVMMTIDLQNHTRTVILHGRVCAIPESEFRRIQHPDNPQGYFGSLLRHPHFWDMIDRQTGPDCGPCVATKPQMCPITNRGISCFGRPENPIDQNVIWIRIGNRPSDNTFERLCIRYYKRVTDDSLRHLVQCSPHLIYLDVSGCGVTQKGVDEFRALKPDCIVICEHLQNFTV